MLTVYANEALGAYGYVEKPWYRLGERLRAFLAEVAERQLPMVLREPPAATDEELTLFHTPEHVAFVAGRCATNRGSLDRAPAEVNARSRRLLQAIAAQPDANVTAAALADVLQALEATLPAFAPFLESEGLVTWDATAGTMALTAAGASFLADPSASLGGPTSGGCAQRYHVAGLAGVPKIT